MTRTSLPAFSWYRSESRKWLGLSVTALAFTMCGVTADAQQSKKMPRVGVLISASRAIAKPRLQAFQQGLRELGYVEGQNIIFEYRYADGKSEPVPEFAAELVGLNVDILVVDTSFATEAAKNATKMIPVVFTT